MGSLILIKCTSFDPYLIVMHMQTEGDNLVLSSKKMRLLLTLFESKLHIIIIFHLKTNKQKLEKTSRKLVPNPYTYCSLMYFNIVQPLV